MILKCWHLLANMGMNIAKIRLNRSTPFAKVTSWASDRRQTTSTHRRFLSNRKRFRPTCGHSNEKHKSVRGKRSFCEQRKSGPDPRGGVPAPGACRDIAPDGGSPHARPQRRGSGPFDRLPPCCIRHHRYNRRRQRRGRVDHPGRFRLYSLHDVLRRPCRFLPTDIADHPSDRNKRVPRSVYSRGRTRSSPLAVSVSVSTEGSRRHVRCRRVPAEASHTSIKDR
jgi:hypothetical protein